PAPVRGDLPSSKLRCPALPLPEARPALRDAIAGKRENKKRSGSAAPGARQAHDPLPDRQVRARLAAHVPGDLDEGVAVPLDPLGGDRDPEGGHEPAGRVVHRRGDTAAALLVLLDAEGDLAALDVEQGGLWRVGGRGGAGRWRSRRVAR